MAFRRKIAAIARHRRLQDVLAAKESTVIGMKAVKAIIQRISADGELLDVSLRLG